EPNKANVGGGPAQSPEGTSKNAERVRSSRYEWESRSDGSDNSSAAATASGASLMAYLGRWWKKLFSGDRGFFDNDDDPTPSAA
ncbi:MAG: hypothetical protein WA738_01425, partial [Candidatus Angelobacter sp.]